MFKRIIMKHIVSKVLSTLASEPGGKIIVQETRSRIIKAEVMSSGAKRFSIHKVGIAKTGRKVWRYTTYAVSDTGGYHALYSGQYPYSWED